MIFYILESYLWKKLCKNKIYGKGTRTLFDFWNKLVRILGYLALKMGNML